MSGPDTKNIKQRLSASRRSVMGELAGSMLNVQNVKPESRSAELKTFAKLSI
jgi:hypothetical protein